MLSDKQRNELPRELEDVYEELNTTIIRDLAKRVQSTLEYVSEIQYDLDLLREQGFTKTQIQSALVSELNSNAGYQQLVAQNDAEYKAMIKRKMAQVEKMGINVGGDLLDEAEQLSLEKLESLWSEANMLFPNAQSQIMGAVKEEFLLHLKNLTNTKGLIMRNGYIVTSLTSAYTTQLDIALIKVASGLNYQEALKECVRELAESGVREIIYQKGNRYVTTGVDVACRRAMLTASNKLAGNIMEQNLIHGNVAYVEVSSHTDARPDHAEWQGKVYKLDGAEPEYPNFYEATKYGQGEGLLGYNCRHSFYPFWPDISEPAVRHEEKQVTVKDKTMTLYEATQYQRKFERTIRALKREQMALDAIGESDAELNSLIERKQKAYIRFSKLAGLRPKTERTEVLT